VRGFIYQGVGPRLADNTPIGGDSLFEASAEVRQQVSGPWGVVAFVDAGSLSPTAVPDFRSLSVGAGVGVRYNLGFGPLRLDIAAPVTHRAGDPWVQLYLSIGQSF
jgi:translocation and assembly module TamA